VHQAAYPVKLMCRLLKVSRSGYYAWLNRPPSKRAREDAGLTVKIKEIHTRSKGTYGAPRIQEYLTKFADTHVGCKRVARLMKAADLRGVSRRQHVVTTQRAKKVRPAPDLVNRNFTAKGPNNLWSADITHIATWAGTLYLAVVLDVWSRKIVGWAMASHMKMELVWDAVLMAVSQRQPKNVIHHSDQGSQYTSVVFGNRCKAAGLLLSMGSVGDCYDNAIVESFFATLECELLDRHTFRTRTEARQAVFAFIEGWYNPHRMHSSLGYWSPNQFEQRDSPSPQTLA